MVKRGFEDLVGARGGFSSVRIAETIAEENALFSAFQAIAKGVGVTLREEVVPSFEQQRVVLDAADELYRRGRITIEQYNEVLQALRGSQDEVVESGESLTLMQARLGQQVKDVTQNTLDFGRAQRLLAVETAAVNAELTNQVNLWRTNPDVFRGDFARQAAERRRRLSGGGSGSLIANPSPLFPGLSVSTPSGGTFTTVRRAVARPDGGLTFT